MSDGSRLPSLYDVAMRAGVSHQTVSRVVSGFSGVRAVTRERVLAAIDETGYRPNLAARALATRRTRAIGVLAPATADFGPTSTVLAVETAARAAGYESLLTTTAINGDAVRNAIALLRDRAIEAVIAVAPYQVVLDHLDEAALPVVALQTARADAVSVGHSTPELVQHLVDLGHRSVQQITGPHDFLEAQARADSIRSALSSADVREAPPLRGDWSADSGYAASERLDPGATAVLCGNDRVALGLIHALADRGKRVPDDLSVVGFDDIPEAAHSLPPLTTVRQDFAEVGRRAVAAALALINGTVASTRGPVPSRLIVRASTAAPRR